MNQCPSLGDAMNRRLYVAYAVVNIYLYQVTISKIYRPM